MLIADADDTLLGDRAALRTLRRLVAGLRIAVMVNSSRPLDSVADSFAGRLEPVAIGGALGTQLTMFGRRVGAWERRFEYWDGSRAYAVLAGMGFSPHASIHQTSTKVSFAVPVPSRVAARKALTASGQPHRVIVSGSSNFDVIPPGAGKAPVARYVARRLGIPLEATVSAGDSANDADLLGVGRGVLVGNATPALRSATRHLGLRPTRGRRARGVIEGLLTPEVGS